MSEAVWSVVERYGYALFPKTNEEDYPVFDPRPEISRFDLSTFQGRMHHMYSILDPLTLFVPESRLNESEKKLQNPSDYKKSELWEAKRLIQSARHPDSNETIEWPFRFSAFAVLNIPIVLFLIYPSNSVFITAGSQILNQSYNTAVNYKNRSAGSKMTNSALLTSYSLAVGSSVGVSVGLKKYCVKRYSHILSQSGMTSTLFRGLVPYTALVIANCLNVLLIRWPELMNGIPVSVHNNTGPVKIESEEETMNDEYIDLGLSKKASRDALFKCCIARVVWNLPPMVIPPLIIRFAFQSRRWWAKSAHWKKMMVEACVIGGTVMTFIPPSQAIYPQTVHCPIDDLEPELKQALSQARPNLSEQELSLINVQYNKGL